MVDHDFFSTPYVPQPIIHYTFITIDNDLRQMFPSRSPIKPKDELYVDKDVYVVVDMYEIDAEHKRVFIEPKQLTLDKIFVDIKL